MIRIQGAVARTVEVRRTLVDNQWTCIILIDPGLGLPIELQRPVNTEQEGRYWEAALPIGTRVDVSIRGILRESNNHDVRKLVAISRDAKLFADTHVSF